MSIITMSMPFKADVYTKTTTRNDSGQNINNWQKNRTIKCDYMSSRGEERLVQRQQNPISYLLWTNDTAIDNQHQIRNLRDRFGVVIDEGPFNVIGIRKHRAWKEVGHLTLNLQKVLD